MLYLTNDKSRIEAAIEATHKLLKRAGFQYKRSIASASEDRQYVCTATRREINICGWHGTGRGGYGDGKTVHTIYFTHNGDVVNHPKGDFVVRGERDEVRIERDGDDWVSAYDFQGTRCIWANEAQRTAILDKIDAMPETVSNWLRETA